MSAPNNAIGCASGRRPAHGPDGLRSRSGRLRFSPHLLRSSPHRRRYDKPPRRHPVFVDIDPKPTTSTRKNWGKPSSPSQSNDRSLHPLSNVKTKNSNVSLVLRKESLPVDLFGLCPRLRCYQRHRQRSRPLRHRRRRPVLRRGIQRQKKPVLWPKWPVPPFSPPSPWDAMATAGCASPINDELAAALDSIRIHGKAAINTTTPASDQRPPGHPPGRDPLGQNSTFSRKRCNCGRESPTATLHF